jgi:hypothetical protein
MSSRIPTPDQLLSGCYPYNPQFLPGYGYVPSLGAGIAFCVLFTIALLTHCLYGILNRRWTNYLLAVGALGELIGWAGRTCSSQCPYNSSCFLIQIVTLVIAPVFFAAALFVMLAQFTVQRGPQYSLLPAKLYLYVFVTCDIIALLVQAAGAGIASHEFDQPNGDPEKGTNIVVGGLGFQVAAMSVFFLCFLSFIFKSFRAPWPKHEAILVIALLISFTSLYIRCIYRTVQLAQGWLGYLSRHERFFVGLDATLMVVCVGIFVFANPGTLLRPEHSIRGSPREGDVERRGLSLGRLFKGKHGSAPNTSEEVREEQTPSESQK